jgi:hypothetical protein
VIASEVKSLATETAKVAQEIQAKVGNIQSLTRTAEGAIQGISKTVAQMNDISIAIAAAVEEQGMAMRENPETSSRPQKAPGKEELEPPSHSKIRPLSDAPGDLFGNPSLPWIADKGLVVRHCYNLPFVSCWWGLAVDLKSGPSQAAPSDGRRWRALRGILSCPERQMLQCARHIQQRK